MSNVATSDLYNGNLPDFDAIRARFDAHREGRLEHRTAAGHRFQFLIKHNGNGYDAIIEAAPGYGLRASDAHTTHRLPAPGGGYKICFQRPAPDVPTAVCLAMYWADCTSQYIRTGRKFG